MKTLDTHTPDEIGCEIGQAMANDTLANCGSLVWTGLDPQDGDRLTAAGIVPDSEEWDAAERSAKLTFLRAVGRH
jgi:hypothetical protein